MENNSVGQQGEESIPQDIQEKIDKAADDYGFVDTYDGINIIYDQQAVLAFEHGARFGYRLAATPPVSDGKEIEDIPRVIKNKIVGEANFRSKNGHGGIDDTARDNFIMAAEFGYQLAAIYSTKDRLGIYYTRDFIEWVGTNFYYDDETSLWEVMHEEKRYELDGQSCFRFTTAELNKVYKQNNL